MSSRSKKKSLRKKTNTPAPNSINAKKLERSTFIRATSIKAGPLPTPEDLQKYADISPDLVNRIVTMAEKQQNHRHELEKREQKIIPFLYAFGQILGFILALSVLAGGVFLIYNDKSVDGFKLLLGGAALLAGIYVYGKKNAKKEPPDFPTSL